MIVLGLTGSIGMGKSTVAALFAEEGVPGFNSDEAVHALYAAGGAAVAPIEAAFPGVVVDGAVDRVRLAALVLKDPEARMRLEAIVHPLVARAQADFLAANRAAGAPVAVLDIPLLFETGGDKRVDKTVVVSAPPDIQRARVLARPNMTDEKLAAILSAQVPDAEKRARADFVIDTSATLEETRAQVRALLDALREHK
jgi:dephospho-CoA kinase